MIIMKALNIMIALIFNLIIGIFFYSIHSCGTLNGIDFEV